MGTKNQKKTAAQAPKRGRGRPSKVDAQLALTCAFLNRAIAFIQSLQTKEGDEWLEREGQKTAMQLADERKAATAIERDLLKREIAERQERLAAL